METQTGTNGSTRRITEEDVMNCIEGEQVCKLGQKTTCVVLTLRNGFEVVGTSACVDPAGYDQEKGAECARKRAMDKVWELEGYRLQCEMHN